MAMNKARCGMPAWTSAEKPKKAPSGPGPTKKDGTENIDAGSSVIRHPDWQGDGQVVERS